KSTDIEKNLYLISLFLLGVGLLAFLFSFAGGTFATWMLTFGFLLVFGAAGSLFVINFWQKSRHNRSAERIREIASGNISSGLGHADLNSSDHLDLAIKALLDYLNEKASVIDKIASGDISATIELRSQSDTFGNIFQNMLEKLRGGVQTEEERN